MALVPAAWQQPFVNIFRHFKVEEWKRSSKEGDVATVLDKTLGCRVYRVRGAAATSSYIQLPQTGSQSLGLMGRYLYVLFRPLPDKHFVIHLDVSTEHAQVIRVSFSNLFKEFKSTATWLQFPLVCRSQLPGEGGMGPALPGSRWTCLQVDLQDTLLLYLGQHYSHLRGVRLCASLLVRSLFTSDLSFDPTITVTKARRSKLPVTPMPREMAFPVPKGKCWNDLYLYFRFPAGALRSSLQLCQKGQFSPETASQGPQPPRQRGPAALSRPAQQPFWAHGAPRPILRDAGSRGQLCAHLSAADPAALHEASTARGGAMPCQPQIPPLTVVPPCPELGGTPAEPSSQQPLGQEAAPGKQLSPVASFLPDPILRLKGVIGFGGPSAKWALWTRDGASVLYPCHAVIVLLHVQTHEQRFFLGHTDEVSALALDGKSRLLASAQARSPSMLRLWDVCSAQCLCLFRGPIHTVCSLSLSNSGALLCGVGKDGHGRTVVIAWGTEEVGHGGEVAILAKVHTDVDIQTFVVASHDETRMASCGRGSVRLWRLRGGELRSCPVDLGEHHGLHFMDVAFARAQDHTLYTCSRSGHILEVDSQCLAVRQARRLLPAQPPGSPVPQKRASGSGPGIAISCLSVSQTLCAVGSEDGHLRLWPLDFSAVLLETGHEGPVAAVQVSPDGRRVLSTTSAGLLGFLDVAAQEYCVLVRAHTAPVLALAAQHSRGQLATVAQDHTVRIWDLATLQQLYDLVSPEEAPRAVAFHPTQPRCFCGFSSGAVRACSLETPEVLLEHRHHQGAITSLATSPDGNFLFSTCSQGALVQYHCADPLCHVLRVAADVVWQEASGNTLAISSDSRLLAFVGPSRHTVTVADSGSLAQLLQVDICAPDPASSHLDSATAICFGPAPPGHLLVSTSSATILVLDATSGHVVRELSGMQPPACSSLALSADGHLLLMAADRAVKVWDYSARAGPRCQVFIGHSAPVRAVAFTPDQRQVLSIGDAIFLWDILAPEQAAPESAPALLTAPEPHEAGPGPGQPEGTTSRASEHSQPQPPRCGHGEGLGSLEAPGPSPALSLRAFSSGDHVGACEKSRDFREASVAGDGAWGSGEPPGPRASPDLWLGAPHWRAPLPAACRPSAAHPEAFRPAKCVSGPPAGGERLHLKAVVGYSSGGRANLVWSPSTGFFAYSCGRLLVVEDLHSGAQRHWLGHAEEVSTLALSHNAQLLASASGCRPSPIRGRCQIRVWDIPEGSCRQLPEHHEAAVQALAFSPNDRLLASLGDNSDRTLALWSVATAELLAAVPLPEPMHGVAFSPWDAGQLVCVGQGAPTFWPLPHLDAGTALQVHRESLSAEVGAAELTSLCFGAEPLLYCGSSTGRVCVWDTRARRCFLAWQADEGEIGLLQCSGTWLVSGSSSRRLRLWAVGAVLELWQAGVAVRSGSLAMEQELSLDGAVVSAVFHESMDMGVVGTTAGTVWFVSWAEGSNTRLISGHSSQVNEVTFSPNEAQCATCADDGSVRVWSLASLELLVQFQVLDQSCLCVAWSPPSCGRAQEQQLAAGYGDGTLRVFSISHTAMELKVQPHSAALTTIAFSANGQTILSGDRTGLVAVSHLCTGVTLRVLNDHHGAPICTLQSTSKEYGAFGVEGADLWLAASGDQRVSVWASDWLRDHCGLVDWLSFPAPILEDPGHLPPSLATFCPWDRALLVCTGLGMYREMIFYSLHQKQVVKTIPLPDFAMSLSLSSGPHLAAIGFTEGVLCLVDCGSGATQDFTAHVGPVQLCRFSPSARLLFSAAHSEILIWELVPAAAGVSPSEDL
ncbi:WD repeat-containing protein 90 isoform X5 [Sorex araneus]|uniref:WD repeat-containing protein 90 isoform X5 n=1 Tax=Sorex araneus TaxID=42254 RepID=UPI002433482A|nr:WD repeat-containing protein 90 isoform X5 [Sorex araneus]